MSRSTGMFQGLMVKSNVMGHTVTEPSTRMPFSFEAHPERFQGEQGYRIICENGSNFFISNKYGAWRVLDNHHVDAELLKRIGLAIEEAE